MFQMANRFGAVLLCFVLAGSLLVACGSEPQSNV
ncbi:hypothetical protein IJ21_45730 [Paenibacillus sp. 32O-W]|nr:hypothetical protein IJ21_45730 [Paenibacillus sp. 32O-W]